MGEERLVSMAAAVLAAEKHAIVAAIACSAELESDFDQ
jgi:hypothetical protein